MTYKALSLDEMGPDGISLHAMAPLHLDGIESDRVAPNSIAQDGIASDGMALYGSESVRMLLDGMA